MLKRALIPLCLLLSLQLMGCMSSLEYADVPLKPFGQSVQQVGGSALVVLTPVVEEYPLEETHWDNQDGPSWAPQARYQTIIDSLTDLTYRQIPPPIEENVYREGDSFDRKITVPFGAMMRTKIKDLTKRRFNRVKLCPNMQCFVTFRQTSRFDTQFQIRLERFDFWEQPTNYLNLYMKTTLLEGSNVDGSKRTTRHIKEKIKLDLSRVPKKLRENKAAAITYLIDQFLDEAIYRLIQSADKDQ